MTPMTAEARALSAELAELLGQTGIRREGRTFIVPSRSRHGLAHRIDWALDGALFCNCEATRRRDNECWAVKAVREEIEMTGLAESTALVPVRLADTASLVPTEHEISAIKAAAGMAFAGKVALPEELNTEAKVAAVMMYGWELGLKPMTALRHLYIVKGKVQPSCEVMAGLVMSRHPDARLYVEAISDAACTMRLRWPSREVNAVYTVTWDDIKRAGLATGANNQYPQDRMRYHATKRLLRIYAPDVINGLDQASPYIGEAVASSAPSDADFYNEGDDPDSLPYIDGQIVDRETGEIVAQEVSAPPPTKPAPPTPDVDDTKERAASKYRRVVSTLGDKDKAELDALLKGLSAEEALDVLNGVEPEPPADVEQAALPV